jgi:S1-C subfamily serine protease
MSPWHRFVIAVTATVLAASLGDALAQSTRPAPREALVQRAAEALARGDAAAALHDYEAAAAQEHAPDIEAGIVRSLMLGGHYRRALAFAAHTAQAHPSAPEGVRLYAQLLEAGGHAALAARVRPGGEAREAPHAPGAGVLATGVLIDAGGHALLPLSATRDASNIELRDAHGRVLVARLVRSNEALGVALLRLNRPPADVPRSSWAARDAFPGSPAHAIAGASAGPLWPRLRTGFVGARGLGVDLLDAARGGAVLDSAGRMIGLALASDDGGDRLLTVSELRGWLGDTLGDSAAAAAAAPAMPVDAIYETALRATVLLRAPSSRGP